MGFFQLTHSGLMLLSESEPSLWEELWTYFNDKYFSVELGQYENIEIGTGTLLTFRNIILGLFVGLVIASAFASYDKNRLGGFVRKMIREDCLWPEKARTLAELGYQKSPGIRGSLKRGTVLSRTVHCVEKEQYERDMEAARAAFAEKNGSEEGFVAPPFRMDLDTAHFYIPDEEHYAAEVRFEEKGSGWRAFLLVLLVSVVGAALVCWLLPDMLQLVDNMIGILKGDGNAVT